jgi:regulator of G-protein signaling
LINAGGITSLIEFLRLEFSEENLEFWIEFETFRHCREKQRPEFARNIIDGFVVEYAPKQVNILLFVDIDWCK